MGIFDWLFKKKTGNDPKKDPGVREALLWFNKGFELAKSGQHKKASECYEKALTCCERVIETNLQNAETYYTKVVCAEACYIKACCIGELGRLEFQQKRTLVGMKWPPSEHLKAFKRFLEVAPPGYDPERIRKAQELIHKYSDLM